MSDFGAPELAILVQLKDLASAGLKGLSANVGSLETRANGTNFSGFSKATNGLKADAEKAAGKAEGGGGGIGNLIGSLGSVAGPALLAAGGITAVVSAIGESIGAAVDDQKSIASLTTTLKANVPAWDGNTEAIEGYITKAEDASDFAKNDLRASLQSLVGAVKDVTAAENLQTTATNLARYAGISLADATADVIKANEGIYKALTPLGIKIDATTSSTQALAKINALVAGQDSSYIDTQAGQWEKLGNRIEDAKVALGGFIEDQIEAAGQRWQNLATPGANLPIGAGDTQSWDAYQQQLADRAAAYLDWSNQVTADFAAIPAGITATVQPIQRAITAVSTDISDGWNSLEKDAVKTVTKNGRTFQQVVKGAYTSTLNLSPEIVPDSVALTTLYKQLAVAEANRDEALRKHSTSAVEADDANIATITAQINRLVAASDTITSGGVGNKRAGGGYVTGGDYVVGEGGNGQFAESLHLNPGSSGYVVPDGGHAAGGRRPSLTINFHMTFPPTRQQVREIAKLINDELGLQFALAGGSGLFST